ncbi:MAG: S1 RNA-binding domain-containing protein [Butyricicoccus sp.]
MELTVGAIVVGKVTSITKFGAFVSLDEEKTGLVHISEVSQSFVSDIREHLTEGQEVKVKIIAVDENGRINLSIKKAQPREASGNASGRSVPRKPYRSPSKNGNHFAQKKSEAPSELSFEDKLKHFMQDSESRMSDIRHNMDRKSGSRRRK